MATHASGPGLLWRVRLYAFLLMLGIISLVWNLVAFLIHPLLPRRAGTSLGRAVIARVYRRFWDAAEALGLMRIDAGELDVLAAEPGGLILAANHPTMFDALIVVSRLRRGVCIMKADLMRNPFVGTGARLARYIGNDSGREMIRSAVECLREGGQVVMFPEGTRTVRRPLNPFRAGITLIAQRAGVPIQTIIIETDSPYLRKGWPIWRVPPFPVVMRMRLGQRFAPETEHRALLERMERYFVAEVGGLPEVESVVEPIGEPVRL